jgi:tetratricopeptide (TPR) repeat protein
VNELEVISASGRKAVSAGAWSHVDACGHEIRRRAPESPEGPFLLGLARKAAGQPRMAAKCFSEAIELDEGRYDAAIELAWQYVLLNRHAEANDLVGRYRSLLSNSPLYLDLAGQVYSRLGLYEAAWPLYEKALELQPDVERIAANKAACAVYLGKIDEARAIYSKLLKERPSHQRNHYELAQLGRAKHDGHVEEMLAILRKSSPDPAKNIFLYYALGKELEDLGRWDEAFEFYEKGGKAARSTMDYDVDRDVAVIDRIIAVCNPAWLDDNPVRAATEKTPIFIVGLPRTGTTLTDRILSSHSQVESAGETQLLQMMLRRESGLDTDGELTPEVIEAAARRPAAAIADGYLAEIAYRLGKAPFFIDKLPENVLHLGFIAKGWPKARIVHLRRNPMDACFAVYKQSYFRFGYTLDDLARYYLAYDRLSRHWRKVLGDRMLEVGYEQLVENQEQTTRRMLDALSLPFEEACLHFERNAAAVATASSVQVRERVHTRSIGRWKRFRTRLEPLRSQLEAGGVEL